MVAGAITISLSVLAIDVAQLGSIIYGSTIRLIVVCQACLILLIVGIHIATDKIINISHIAVHIT